MNSTKAGIKKILAVILMELLILAIVGIFVYQYVMGQHTTMGIFCLVVACVLFVGLNGLMIYFIKKAK